MSYLQKQFKTLPIFFAVLILLSALVPPAAGLALKNKIQRRLEIRITGNYVPVFLIPKFWLKNATFEWRDRVKLLSGNLEVRYNPFHLLPGSKIRVRLSGKNFKVKLQGDWARVQGIEDAVVDAFNADLEFDRRGLSEIHSINVQSKSFQFKIAASA